MAKPSLDGELLRALRISPDRSLDELADDVGLPRTNFGRSLSRQLLEPIHRLLNVGLVEECDGHYRLSERGRRTLAERALDAEP